MNIHQNLAAAAAILLAVAYPRPGVLAGTKAAEAALVQRAAAIHQRVLTLDSHVDAPSMIIRPDFDIAQRHETLRDLSQVDLPRMLDGGMDGAFFVVFLPQGPLTTEGYAKSRKRADMMFAAIEQMFDQHGQVVERALTPDAAARIVKASKIAIFVGIENGYPLGDDLALLEKYYERGARYITLSHFANNQIADSSTDPNGPTWRGLSPFGEKVVAEMNRLGMMVDISHTSDETFWDVIELTNAPIIASHSGAHAVFSHPRNMNDAMLEALAENGGVVQIIGYSTYLKNIEQDPRRREALKELATQYGNWWRLPADEQLEPRRLMGEMNVKFPPVRADLNDVVDHIDHVVQRIGIDHVGVSMDFDGGGGVEGAADISEMGNLTLELVRRGYSEADIAKIWSGNVLRVLRDVETAADRSNRPFATSPDRLGVSK
jgi:membrane dipeptidase